MTAPAPWPPLSRTSPEPRWRESLRARIASGEAAALRKRAGITQRTMAAALAISSSTLCRIEHGEIAIGTHLSRRYARVLDGLAWHETAGLETGEAS